MVTVGEPAVGSSTQHAYKLCDSDNKTKTKTKRF